MRVWALSGKLSGELSTIDVGNFLASERRAAYGVAARHDFQSVAACASEATKAHRYNVQPHKQILSNPE